MSSLQNLVDCAASLFAHVGLAMNANQTTLKKSLTTELIEEWRGNLKTLLMPLVKEIKGESLPSPLHAQCLELLKSIKDLNRTLDDATSNAPPTNQSPHPGSTSMQQLLRLAEAAVTEAANTGQALAVPDSLQIALYAAPRSPHTVSSTQQPKLTASGSNLPVPTLSNASPPTQSKLTSSTSNLHSSGSSLSSSSQSLSSPNNPGTFHPPSPHGPPSRTASKGSLASSGAVSPKPLNRSGSTLTHSGSNVALKSNLSVPSLSNIPSSPAPNQPLSPKASAALALCAQFAKQESYLVTDLRELRQAWEERESTSGGGEKEARREILAEAQATLKRMGATVKQIAKSLAKDKERRRALKADFAQLTRFYASVAAEEGERAAQWDTLQGLLNAMLATLAAIGMALKAQADQQQQAEPGIQAQPSPHREKEKEGNASPKEANPPQQPSKPLQASPVKLLEESIRLNLRHVLQSCLARDAKRAGVALTHLEKIVTEIRQFLRHAPSVELTPPELDALFDRMRDDLLKQCKALRTCVESQQIEWEKERESDPEKEAARLAILRDAKLSRKERESQGTGPTGAAVREYLIALRASCLNYFETPSDLATLVRACVQQLFSAYGRGDLATARPVLHALGKHTIELRKGIAITREKKEILSQAFAPLLGFFQEDVIGQDAPKLKDALGKYLQAFEKCLEETVAIAKQQPSEPESNKERERDSMTIEKASSANRGSQDAPKREILPKEKSFKESSSEKKEENASRRALFFKNKEKGGEEDKKKEPKEKEVSKEREAKEKEKQLQNSGTSSNRLRFLSSPKERPPKEDKEAKEKEKESAREAKEKEKEAKEKEKEAKEKEKEAKEKEKEAKEKEKETKEKEKESAREKKESKSEKVRSKKDSSTRRDKPKKSTKEDAKKNEKRLEALFELKLQQEMRLMKELKLEKEARLKAEQQQLEANKQAASSIATTDCNNSNNNDSIVGKDSPNSEQSRRPFPTRTSPRQSPSTSPRQGTRANASSGSRSPAISPRSTSPRSPTQDRHRTRTNTREPRDRNATTREPRAQYRKSVNFARLPQRMLSSIDESVAAEGLGADTDNQLEKLRGSDMDAREQEGLLETLREADFTYFEFAEPSFDTSWLKEFDDEERANSRVVLECDLQRLKNPTTPLRDRHRIVDNIRMSLKVSRLDDLMFDFMPEEDELEDYSAAPVAPEVDDRLTNFQFDINDLLGESLESEESSGESVEAAPRAAAYSAFTLDAGTDFDGTFQFDFNPSNTGYVPMDAQAIELDLLTLDDFPMQDIADLLATLES